MLCIVVSSALEDCEYCIPTPTLCVPLTLIWVA